MADERRTSSWWQTAPGALAAVAAFLAAISGLIGGLNQIGVFDRWKRPPTSPTVSASLPRTDTLGASARKRAPAPARRPAPAAKPPTSGAAAPAPAESAAKPAQPPGGSTAAPA